MDFELAFVILYSVVFKQHAENFKRKQTEGMSCVKLLGFRHLLENDIIANYTHFFFK